MELLITIAVCAFLIYMGFFRKPKQPVKLPSLRHRPISYAERHGRDCDRDGTSPPCINKPAVILVTTPVIYTTLF